MSEPRYEIDVSVVHQIVLAMEEAAGDLWLAADIEYPPESREKYPTYERRYQNEMELPLRMLDITKRLRGNFPGISGAIGEPK